MIAINAFMFCGLGKNPAAPLYACVGGVYAQGFQASRFGQAGRRGEGLPRTPSIYATDTWSGWVGKLDTGDKCDAKPKL